MVKESAMFECLAKIYWDKNFQSVKMKKVEKKIYRNINCVEMYGCMYVLIKLYGVKKLYGV